MQPYTYIHCKPDGSPFYVGKGIGSRSHDFRRRNDWHRKTVAKHGKENIKVFVFPCESEQQAFADEMQQIAQLRYEGYVLCNLNDGGTGAGFGNKNLLGHRHSKESIAKMSSARTGKKHSPETKQKIGAAILGKPRPDLIGNKQALGSGGWKHTQESIAKISASKIGKKQIWRSK